MTVFPLLAEIGFFMTLVAIVFIICAVILVLVILIQKGRGGGLGGAFGSGVAGGILGSKTGDFLTWVTIALVGLFLTLAVVMAKFYKPSVSDFGERPAAQQRAVPTEQQQKTELPSVPAATSDANN